MQINTNQILTLQTMNPEMLFYVFIKIITFNFWRTNWIHLTCKNSVIHTSCSSHHSWHKVSLTGCIYIIRAGYWHAVGYSFSRPKSTSPQCFLRRRQFSNSCHGRPMSSRKCRCQASVLRRSIGGSGCSCCRSRCFRSTKPETAAATTAAAVILLFFNAIEFVCIRCRQFSHCQRRCERQSSTGDGRHGRNKY